MKKLKLNLVGLDGNAFSIMAAVSKQARKEGWSADEIESLMAKMKSGNYNHLLSVAMEVCE